ncbi:phosphoribosylformylglycinamidine cyclo-ligase [Chloroflexota bacterium]
MDNKYAAAGVNLDAADSMKALIKKHAQKTLRPEVLNGPGLFGGLFELSGFSNAVLVSSVDGVGTKLKIAIILDRHDTVGIDIVNHCVNDILTSGAEPLFFLDYIAMGKLVPSTVQAIVKGLSTACQEIGCALIGGETAEMPGLYSGKDYDLAGFIVGAVEKENVIDGSRITTGDILIGLPSSGLHTNGYSLARKVLGESATELNKYSPELGRSIGDALLEPHTCYYKRLKPHLPIIKGLAHITGGGFGGNIPRIMPDDLAASLNSKAWEVPPLFKLIQQAGGIEKDEMYRVFNMGIGMIMICSADNAAKIIKELPDAGIIGKIVKQAGAEQVIIG